MVMCYSKPHVLYKLIHLAVKLVYVDRSCVYIRNIFDGREAHRVFLRCEGCG